MKDWQNCRIYGDQTILEALAIIDNSSLQIALVVSSEGKLLGTITDGDIRRAILRNQSLQDDAASIMNIHPQVANNNEARQLVLAKMRDLQLLHLPVVDDQGIVVGLISLSDLAYQKLVDNPVVLMVGGLGSRLRPLTEDCPKPLLKIGNKPILQTILENFIEYGFHQFYFAVNYKADMIERYFGDGSKFGVNITYLHETKRMGTAGALSLLPEHLRLPVLVMNGDLLTKVNFKHMLEFHLEHRAVATMGVREYSYQIPYGVVQFQQGKISALEEKPVHTSFVNAGIYILEPDSIQTIEKNTMLDMPDLFNHLIQKEKVTVAFPIREYWMDIGQMADFQKAQGEYGDIFK